MGFVGCMSIRVMGLRFRVGLGGVGASLEVDGDGRMVGC
jgi:hypothetical protein